MISRGTQAHIQVVTIVEKGITRNTISGVAPYCTAMNVDNWDKKRKCAHTRNMALTLTRMRVPVQNLDSTLKIKIDNDYLENSQSEKVFGVTIDESLCWTEQVDKTCKKIIFHLHI